MVQLDRGAEHPARRRDDAELDPLVAAELERARRAASSSIDCEATMIRSTPSSSRRSAGRASSTLRRRPRRGCRGRARACAGSRLRAVRRRRSACARAGRAAATASGQGRAERIAATNAITQLRSATGVPSGPAGVIVQEERRRRRSRQATRRRCRDLVHGQVPQRALVAVVEAGELREHDPRGATTARPESVDERAAGKSASETGDESASRKSATRASGEGASRAQGFGPRSRRAPRGGRFGSRRGRSSGWFCWMRRARLHAIRSCRLPLPGRWKTRG